MLKNLCFELKLAKLAVLSSPCGGERRLELEMELQMCQVGNMDPIFLLQKSKLTYPKFDEFEGFFGIGPINLSFRAPMFVRTIW